MATQIKSTQAVPVDDATLWSMSPRSMDEVAKAYTTWLEQVSDEAFRFAHDRLTQDIEAAAQLMRCSDPKEAFTLQAEFASKLAADYLAEGEKMFEWASQLATERHLKARQNTGGRQHAR